ncbi:MAG TPA: protein-L-isoaspartate(D-aspartate) O-methyltransferase [Myxococcota bacterium]|jgi:protein-L-isoaspartate(D-aspartate) O-methyltransferase
MEDRFSGARRRLALKLAADGIRDARVLEAIASVPRHLLIADALCHQAYEDVAIPIGEGQTISAPGIVAAMTQALELTGKESVLEIGTGSAYQAAILARLAQRVISVERIPALATRARTALDRLGVTNVVVYLGDGTRGRPADGPFDAILVTAGGPEIPAPLLAQLAPGGRLVGPFGARGAQTLVRVRRARDGRFSEEALGACRFVDLIGEHGFRA